MADNIKNEELNEVAGGAINAEVGFNPQFFGSTARTYTVQVGDTLASIAGHFHIRSQDLYEANRAIIADPNKIFPGQVLKIWFPND